MKENKIKLANYILCEITITNRDLSFFLDSLSCRTLTDLGIEYGVSSSRAAQIFNNTVMRLKMYVKGNNEGKLYSKNNKLKLLIDNYINEITVNKNIKKKLDKGVLHNIKNENDIEIEHIKTVDDIKDLRMDVFLNIYQSKLSARLNNSLRSAFGWSIHCELNSVHEFLSKPDEYFLKLPGISHKSLIELKEFLKSIGLSLEPVKKFDYNKPESQTTYCFAREIVTNRRLKTVLYAVSKDKPYLKDLIQLRGSELIEKYYGLGKCNVEELKKDLRRVNLKLKPEKKNKHKKPILTVSAVRELEEAYRGYFKNSNG
uniref:Uncharacterized protein n=1 Tax=Francisella tularensis subsp. novicida PA10-7858 TaxID=1386968 RepID=V5T9Q7_FRANO|nr:hypothetical protein N894_0038 [Francisella tularensis subsp. novicida PA10-7858]